MSTWPDKFRVLKDSFSEGLPDRVIKTQMDIGPAKKRRRTYLASYIIKFTCIVELNDIDDFREFYLNNDYGVFDFKHPRTEQYISVRFNSVPNPVFDESLYKISVELEVMP